MSQSTQFMRTDKAIQAALIMLLKEKPFERITVQDILDETPVTRATFYHHYRDKYEIAERMQEEFMEAQKKVREELQAARPSRFPSIIHNSLIRNREQMEALLKIRTEKVDLKSALAKELEEQYLMGDGGEGHRTEAAIFAQAMTTFQLSFLEDGSVQFSTEYVTRTFLAVMLKILGLEHDRETVSFLKRKLSLADGAVDRHADKTANEAAHGA